MQNKMSPKGSPKKKMEKKDGTQGFAQKEDGKKDETQGFDLIPNREEKMRPISWAHHGHAGQRPLAVAPILHNISKQFFQSFGKPPFKAM